jgi:hypothetical protein
MIDAVFVLCGGVVMMCAMAIATIMFWTDRLPFFIHGALIMISMLTTILGALLVGLGL